MRNLILTDEVIGPERDVILEERRSRIEGSPEALLAEEIDATLYQNQPYRIPVIGWMQEMEKLNRTDAAAFYDQVLCAEQRDAGRGRRRRRGDSEVRALRRRPMARCRAGRTCRRASARREPEQNTKRTVTMRDARVSMPSFPQSWVVPSYHTAEDGEAEALDLLSEILGGGTRSRIYQQLSSSRRHRFGRRRLYSTARTSTTPASRSMARRAARPARRGRRRDRRRDRQDHQGRRDRERAGESARTATCAR